MALVSRVATLRLNGTGAGFREWKATATVQDTPAGQRVDVTLAFSGGTLGAPLAPDTLTVTFRNSSGTAIKTFSGLSEQNFIDGNITPFWFTSNGNSGQPTRCGTIVIDIRATRSSGTVADNYDVETDGNPATVPSGVTIATTDQGWIRGTTTAVSVLSNVAIAGAKNQPAEYDESLFHRLTLADTPYTSQTIVLSATSGVSGSVSASIASSTTTFDSTQVNVVDDRWASAVQTLTTAASPANSTGAATGQPWTVLTTYTADTISVDSRLDQSHHFQVGDDVFGVSKNDTSRFMLAEQSGFVATRFTTRRTATGVNGLTVATTNDPVQPGSNDTGTSTTATRDGQAGWTDLVPVCSTGKPGGVWNKTVDVTAPADIDLNTHLVNPTSVITVGLLDPRISALVKMSGTDPNTTGRHFEAGDVAKIAVTLYNRLTRARLLPDAAPTLFLTRYDVGGGKWQFLDSDGATWVDWGANAAAEHVMAQEVSDSFSYALEFGNTDGWGTIDIVGIECVFLLGGTPYGFKAARELVSSKNRHDQYAIVVNPIDGSLDVA